MHIKGSALRARCRWVQKRGLDDWERYLEALTPEVSRQAAEGYLSSQWYPLAHLDDLVETADRLFGTGDLSLAVTLGRYAGEVNLPTLYKLFFRVGNIHYILDKSAAAWKVNYDEGALAVLERRDRGVSLEIRDVPLPSRVHCLSVKGWISRAAELSGVKNVREVQPETCRAKGDDTCAFHFEWD